MITQADIDGAKRYLAQAQAAAEKQGRSLYPAGHEVVLRGEPPPLVRYAPHTAKPPSAAAKKRRQSQDRQLRLGNQLHQWLAQTGGTYKEAARFFAVPLSQVEQTLYHFRQWLADKRCACGQPGVALDAQSKGQVVCKMHLPRKGRERIAESGNE